MAPTSSRRVPMPARSGAYYGGEAHAARGDRRFAAVEVVHLPLLFCARTGNARRLRPPRDPRRALEVARRGKLGA
jgi:hypothetical protein